METPLRLEIEGIKPSAHLREIIGNNVEKLEHRFGRITACRVAIQAPNAHHRMGEPYKVSVWISLPGHREIGVKPPKALDRQLGDLMFAVNDAFRRADRQLRDKVAKTKGRPATLRPLPQI